MLIEGPVIDEISSAITDMIEEVIKIADKYGLGRDDVLKEVAVIFYEMMEVATYQNYECEKSEMCTRIERIRSMSIEEMVDAIMESGIDTMIDFCQNFCGECENIPESECRKCLIKYLNSPEKQQKSYSDTAF